MQPDLLEARQEEIETFRGDLYKRDYMTQAKPFAVIGHLFERLRGAGLRSALASSGKEEVAVYKELLGIADLIDSATTSDDAERSKLFPDNF